MRTLYLYMYTYKYYMWWVNCK